MPLPEYPQTILFLLLVWCMVALSVVYRCQWAHEEQYQPFCVLIQRRFGKKPSKILLGLYGLLLLLVFFLVGDGIGFVELAVMSFWLIIYLLMLIESYKATASCPAPMLEEGAAPPYIWNRAHIFFYNAIYVLIVILGIFILLAFSVALHRVVPIFQERCYLTDGWFFVKLPHESFSLTTLPDWPTLLRLVFVDTPYFFFLCLTPLVGAALLFNFATGAFPGFSRYRSLRSYATFYLDCFNSRDQREVWDELVHRTDHCKLRMLQKQKLWRLALFVWIFGGVGFVLSFDHYAKVYTEGIVINPLFSFAEVVHSWKDVRSADLESVKLSRDDDFGVQVVLNLADGQRLKIWSYFVLTGPRIRRAGREQGHASTSDALKLIEILRSNNVVLAHQPFTLSQLALLEHYPDEEVKRSVFSVYNTFTGVKADVNQAGLMHIGPET